MNPRSSGYLVIIASRLLKVRGIGYTQRSRKRSINWSWISYSDAALGPGFRRDACVVGNGFVATREEELERVTVIRTGLVNLSVYQPVTGIDVHRTCG